MKYAKEIPKGDQKLIEILITDGWTKIKEPHGLLSAILASLPFMIFAPLLTYLVLSPFEYAIHPIKQIMEHGFSLTITLWEILGYLIILYVFVILHELLHAIMIPHFYTSNKTWWGLTVQGGFVCTTEKLSKSRYYIISLAPFLFLSILFPFFLGLIGLLNPFLFCLALINAMGSSVDIMNMMLIAFQVPRGSTIINTGFETFYKEEPFQ